MASRNGRFNIFLKNINTDKAKEKAEEKRKHISRINDMQRFVDLSEEKLNLLLDTLQNHIDPDTNKPIIQMGCVVYTKYLDVADRIEEFLQAHNIRTLKITGKSTQKQRESTSEEFAEKHENTVVVITAAAGESLDLNYTPHICLHDAPDGMRNFSQIIGRIVRGFGEFTKFYVHEIIIEGTLDEYKQVLLSSKKELEKTILNSDTIPLKNDIGSFDAQVLKKVRNDLLWRKGLRKRKP